MTYSSSDRKKMTSLYILDILKKYTDDTYDKDGNPVNYLTQNQIKEHLLKDYNISIDRKAVARGLDDLINSPTYCDKIEFETKPRKVGGSNEIVETKTNYYYVHDFDSAQIRLLMDAVLFSKNISRNECNYLIEKLSNLGVCNSYSKLILNKHLYRLSCNSNDRVANAEFLNNLDVIEDAIIKSKKITYTYNSYGTDAKLHPKKGPDGKPLIRTVNPYAIQASNGRFYLVCNYDEFDNYTIARIDKITDIEILDEPAKSAKDVKELKNHSTTLPEQVYMFAGKPETIIFKAINSENVISELIDWFGKSIKFTKENDDYITCKIRANPKSIKYWAMQYSDHVEILEPESLRDDIRDSLRSAWGKYNRNPLVETDAEIQKLINEWEELSEKSKSRNEEDRKVDVKALGSLVKRTHSVLIPFFGQKLEGHYELLLLKLEKISREQTHIFSDSHCISLILGAIIDKVRYGKRYAASGISENTLQIRVRKAQNERIVIKFELDNFEEDYLTLKQYTDEKAEEARNFHEEFYKKLKEKRKAEAEQRRKEREAKKK